MNLIQNKANWKVFFLFSFTLNDGRKLLLIHNMIPFSLSLSTLSFFWTFSFFSSFFRKMENFTLNGARNSLLTPLFFVLKFFLNFFFKIWGSITLNRERNSQLKIWLPLPSFSIFSLFSTFLVFHNFFWQVVRICLWTVDAICYDINNFTLLYLSVWKFYFSQLFVFLNFLRVLRKLYFERWMQIAIKCIKGSLHL